MELTHDPFDLLAAQMQGVTHYAPDGKAGAHNEPMPASEIKLILLQIDLYLGNPYQYLADTLPERWHRYRERD